MRNISAVVVGAGFGGLAVAARLKEQGVEDLTIVERGDRPGGVWRANTYPGAACDIPSRLYSLSLAPKADWSRKFAPGPEIQAYAEQIVDRFGLRAHLRTGVEVERAAFDDERGVWRLRLSDGSELEADVFAPACGQLSRPLAAVLPGIERFAGRVWHSAEWDHTVALDGKRVAVVGTGASVIQVVPAIAPEAGHVTVFQRSAPWLLPRGDREVPRVVRTLYARAPALQRAVRELYYRLFEFLVPVFVGEPKRSARWRTRLLRGLSTAQRRWQLRGHPELLERATPTYPIGCKRILLSDDWYPALRRPDVALVTAGIREVVPEGVVDGDGTLHEADVIVLGTGFAATQFLVPMEVVGRGGVALADAWRDGAEAHLGITVPDFPNMFLLYGPHTNHGTGSILTVLESAAQYVADAVAKLQRGTVPLVEVRREAFEAFEREMDARLAGTVWAAGCHNWYVTANGRVTNNWPGTHAEYAQRTRQVALADLVSEPLPRANVRSSA
jgi:cation diffusion facilitator CzcD-associated flavoprotein CzcO